MIQKLRLKIAAISMIAVALVMVVSMATLALSTRSQMIQSSETQLLLALNGKQSSALPGGGSVPCFVAEVNSVGTVHLSGSSYYDLQDESLVISIVQEALEADSDSGVLPAYHLRYLRRTGTLSVRIAFTDSTLEQSTLRGLLLRGTLVSLAALVILTAGSYLLSGFAVRPVKRAWEDQKRFVSDASHELKTPLTVILSSTDLAAEETDMTSLRRYNDNIRAESLRMKSLVEDLLTLARAESGVKSPPSPFDLSETVLESALAFEPVAFEAGRRLVYTIQPNLLTTGYSHQLRQVADILLENAVKYAPPGAEICVSLLQEGRNAKLWVENPGDTIPPEKLPHLFDRFYRVDESRAGGQGFGLGLAIAKTIVQQHKGAISCQSRDGLTRFTVTIPLQKR